MIYSRSVPTNMAIVLTLLMSACQQSIKVVSPPLTPPVATASPSPSSHPVSAPAKTTIKLLKPAAKKLRVDSYFSMYSYGPVQYFYHFEEHGAVLHLYIANETSKFSPAARLHFFTDTDAPNIGKWINNQHSDGLYADAPAPNESIDLSGQISVRDKTKLTPTTGRNGEAYDVYELTLALETWQRPPYLLKAFEENTLVRVRLNDGPSAPQNE